MSSLSFLRSLALVLLLGATAEAQTVIVEDGPEPPVTIISGPPDYALDRGGPLFGGDWLGLSTRPPRYNSWLNAEYLLMWLNEANLPPIFTTSPSNVPVGFAAAVGQSTTTTRLGANGLDSDPTAGLRFSAGTWFHCPRGLEIGGFIMADRTKSYALSASGDANSPAIGRPITVPNTRSETVLYTAFANRFAGVGAADQNTSLWGIDANGLFRLTEDQGPFFFAVLGGVRYLDFNQDLRIQNTTTPLGTFSIPVANLATIENPNFVHLTDSFRTSNYFIGAQIGVRGAYELGRFGLGLGFKVAFGPTHQIVQISGQSEGLTPNGQLLATAPGGLLANVANIGRGERDGFSAVPEAEFKIRYRWTDSFYTFFGYNYMIWQHVAMAGNQFSRTVNPNNVPTSGAYNVGQGAVGSTPVLLTDLNLDAISFGFVLTY